MTRRRPVEARGATSWGRRAVLVALVAGLAPPGCSDGLTSLSTGDQVELEITNLRALPAGQGTLRLWVTTSSDTLDLGPLEPTGSFLRSTVRFVMPVDAGRSVFVTVEPPADPDPGPSGFDLLEGRLEGDRARLDVLGSVTDGRPFQREPGAHSLFTTSNNVELGYPSFEDAGLWLFTLRPGENVHGTREVRVTPLRRTWVYEGWIVKGYGSGTETWISYGKFRPDQLGLLNSRDDTGSGPFSGDEDYLNAGVEDVPGEEWTTDVVAAQLGIDLPEPLVPPLDLDHADPVSGRPTWTHVITVEPAFDEGEPLLSGRSFVLRPYRNPIGPGGPGSPRIIRFEEEPPTATLRRIG